MSWYRRESFLYLALDPIHVGAGGNRLGRVDMTIAREPGTNLPKVPGTSLAGAARSYAAMSYGKQEAAGQQKKMEKKDAAECPILYTFGTASDDPGASRAGAVSISDARILFFPVYSSSGPVWVTTAEILREAGFDTTTKGVAGLASAVDPGQVGFGPANAKKRVNLGWLLLEIEQQPAEITEPTEWKEKRFGQYSGLYNEMKQRVVLVTPKYFSQIVNNHLEVRTSVSIAPETGAAEEHALFTYEAIPRGTWLLGDVVVDDFRDKFPKTSQQYLRSSKQECKGDALPGGEEWKQPLDVVHSGLRKIEMLGVGGMGTRGFGRMKMVASWECR